MISERQQWINLWGVVILVATVSTFVFRKRTGPKWLRVGCALLVWLLTGLLTFSLPFYLFPLLEDHLDLLDIVAVRALIAIAALGLGLLAYVFKRKNKILYGQAEVVVGFLTATTVAGSMASSKELFSSVLALASACYVIARGFNNWSEELEEHGNKYGHRTLKVHLLSFVVEMVEVSEPSENGKGLMEAESNPSEVS